MDLSINCLNPKGFLLNGIDVKEFLVRLHLFSFDFDLSSGRATESSNG